MLRLAAVRAALGVALDDRHCLDRHPELVGQDLGERRRVALALRRRADEAAHFPGRLDPHRGGVVTRDLSHAAQAERSRPHAGELRVRGDADTAVLPDRRVARLGAPARVVAARERALQRLLGIAAVDDQPGRRLERQLAHVDEVATPDVDGIEAGAPGDHVDDALAHERAQRHADAAVRAGRALVGGDGVRLVGERADLVRPGQDAGSGQRLQ